jgi:hypothetical protein
VTLGTRFLLVIASTGMIIHAPLPLAGECSLCGESRHLGYIDSDIGPVCYDCATDLYETEHRVMLRPSRDKYGTTEETSSIIRTSGMHS